MKNSLESKTDQEILEIVPKIKDNILFEEKNKIVYLLIPYDKPLHRFFRKFKKNLPKFHKMELDEYGSFVFLSINGKKSIEEIGVEMQDHFKSKDSASYTYERLLLFLNHLNGTFIDM